MLCDKCGSKVSDNSVFCNGCKVQFEQMREGYQQASGGKSHKKKLAIIVSACVVALLCVAVFLRPATPYTPQTQQPTPNFAGDATTVSAGYLHTVGLRSDGTVVTTRAGYAEVIAGWSDIVEVVAGQLNTVGLRADGTVVGTVPPWVERQIGDWEDIVAVATQSSEHVIGLRADGTVLSTFAAIQEQVDDWREIVAISVGLGIIVGLRADGTVVTVGSFEDRSWRSQAAGWQDIVAVSAGDGVIAGLRSDSTVVAAGNNHSVRAGALDVDEWYDIIAISAGRNHVVGLRADGTVLSTSQRQREQISEWRDIVAVSAAEDHTVGLRSDGTVVAVGSLNALGQLNVTDWENIKQPSVREPDLARFQALAEYEAALALIVEEPPIELTPEEIRELLESIPYQGTSRVIPSLDWVWDRLSIAHSETARELVDFIYAMNRSGQPPLLTSFRSPQEAEHAFLLSRTFWATGGVQWRDPESEWASYFPELVAIEPYVELPWEVIVLHSHMEQTTRQLFGVELEIDPYAMNGDSESGSWSFVYNIHGIYAHNQGGFSLGPHMRLPIILSYEYIGGGYEVVCIFPWIFFGEEENLFYPEGHPRDEPGLTHAELLEYLETTTMRHTITLMRNQDGGLYYHAHILPD